MERALWYRRQGFSSAEGLTALRPVSLTQSIYTRYVEGVKSESEPIFAIDCIDWFAAAGRYHFTSTDARQALDVSPDAVRLALNKLSRQGLIASPERGFYVIVPPEYRSPGFLPAERFIPALMARKDRPFLQGCCPRRITMAGPEPHPCQTLPSGLPSGQCKMRLCSVCRPYNSLSLPFFPLFH